MEMTRRYASPLGELWLAANENGLKCVHFARPGEAFAQAGDVDGCAGDILAQTERWLDGYFAGKAPVGLPPLAAQGTDFQREVWELLLQIPYGCVTSYGALAAELGRRRGGRMAAQAVGGAVGRNPIAILVPCHRVVGTDGSLTGYAGGMDKKAALLALERADCTQLCAPWGAI